MNTDIRKISVGKDFPDGAIHYQVGKTIRLQNKPYTVTQISISLYLKNLGKIGYDIFIADECGTVLWKTICDVPVVIENNIDFD